MSSAPTKSLPSGADKNKMKKGLLHWFLSLCNSLFLFVRNVSPDPDRLPERHPTLFDIPMRWDPQRELTVRALRVAFADFSAAPWQGLEKSERGPNNSSLHSLFCRYATSSPGRGKSLAAGRGRRRCCSSPDWPSERHPTLFDIPSRWDPRAK